jgi:TonB family protein
MLNHARNAAVWLSLAAFGAGAVLAVPVAAGETASVRKITKRVPPVYSTFARQSRMRGMVKLLVVVDPDGNVKSVRTIGGNPLFVREAEAAVKQWKYEAATKETTESIALKYDNPV